MMCIQYSVGMSVHGIIGGATKLARKTGNHLVERFEPLQIAHNLAPLPPAQHLAQLPPAQQHEQAANAEALAMQRQNEAAAGQMMAKLLTATLVNSLNIAHQAAQQGFLTQFLAQTVANQGANNGVQYAIGAPQQVQQPPQQIMSQGMSMNNGMQYAIGVPQQVQQPPIPDVPPQQIMSQSVPMNSDGAGSLYPENYGDPPFDAPDANIKMHELLHKHLKGVERPQKYAPDGDFLPQPGSGPTLEFLKTIPADSKLRDFIAWSITKEYDISSQYERPKELVSNDVYDLLPDYPLPTLRGPNGIPLQTPNSQETINWLHQFNRKQQQYMLLAIIYKYQRAMKLIRSQNV